MFKGTQSTDWEEISTSTKNTFPKAQRIPKINKEKITQKKNRHRCEKIADRRENPNDE